jgi:hypothetical protein
MIPTANRKSKRARINNKEMIYGSASAVISRYPF